jgi:hypothetical protein
VGGRQLARRLVKNAVGWFVGQAVGQWTMKLVQTQRIPEINATAQGVQRVGWNDPGFGRQPIGFRAQNPLSARRVALRGSFQPTG